MRFMLLLKADKNTEAGVLPSEDLLAAMGKFNEEMVKAGVLLAGEGLQPSAKGARIHFSAGKRTVTDGPFAETQGLLAGFWLIQVKSKEEAIEWAKRSGVNSGPKSDEGMDAEIEVRQVFEALPRSPRRDFAAPRSTCRRPGPAARDRPTSPAPDPQPQGDWTSRFMMMRRAVTLLAAITPSP